MKANDTRDFYLADQLVSLNVIFYDFEQSFCYYVYDVWYPRMCRPCISPDRTVKEPMCGTSHKWLNPIMAGLPALWRLLQCLRRVRDGGDKWQLVNVGKYASSLLLVTFSFLRRVFDGVCSSLFPSLT